MKRQQLFHSFLPGVTAAVLTTQPSWAQTIDVGEVNLVASPNVSTATYSRNLVTNDTKAAQLPTVTPTGITTVSHQLLSSNSIEVVVTGKTGVPIGQINSNAQNVLFSLTPATGYSQQQDVNPSASSNQTQTSSAIGQKSQISTSKLLDLGSPSAKMKNPDTQLLTVSQMPARRAGAAELLQQPQQNTTSGNWVAQANTPTPRVPPANLAPATPATPATVPTRPAPNSTPGSTINPQVPTTTPPTPTNSTPIVPTTKPVSGGSSVQVPDYLNANPNLLQFPTRTEEVRIQGTQPVSLAQALEIARRNNRDLQVSLLTLERYKYAVRQAQASLFPTFNLNAGVTRGRNLNTTLYSGTDPTTGQLIPSQNPAYSAFDATAELTYSLYTSGQRLANIRANEEQERYYQLDVERESEDIRLNVANGYYNLQQADQQVRIYQAAVLNYQSSLRDALALERAGVGTRFDVLQAQANLATNGVQPLTSAIAQQRIARRQFALLLSLPQSVDISASDPVQLAGLWNHTLEESIVLAFQKRPELEQQLAQRNASEQRRRLDLAQLGPQISLVGNYQLENIFNASNNSNTNNNVVDGYSLAVRATVNLFDGGAARASANQERINIRIADTQFATQRNTIREQVEEAYFNLQSNLENVQTSSTALEQAREALRLARLRFQAGVGTQTDVINQEALLINAEGNRLTAILNYNRNLAQLQRYVTSRGLP